MNFYVVVGSRANQSVHALTLDAEAQADLGAMLEPLIEAILKADSVPHDSGYRADDDEVVVIAPYVPPPTLNALVDSAQAALLPSLKVTEVEDADIRAIAAIDWKNTKPRYIALQRLEARYVLRREGWRLMFADGRFVRDHRSGLEIARRVDAVLQDDALHVVSWPKTHAILDLSQWMREATVTEMDQFFKHKKLALEDDFNAESIADTTVRRKIASITERDVLKKCSVQALQKYATKFGIAIRISKGRIVLPSQKKEFKTVLGLLDEDLLSFEPTDERWVVNSKRRVTV